MADTDRPTLRAQMRAARRALSPRQRLAAAEAVAAHLRETFPTFEQPSRIAGYWACDGELPLHPLLAGRPSFSYLLPRLLPGKRLAFQRWRTGEALASNRYGIPEPALDPATATAPEDLDLVLLPLLAFDRRGHRLGSGGGYYDRSFAFRRAGARPAKPLLVGVGYALQEVAALAVEEWDVGLDYVVTEEGAMACGAAACRKD